MRAHLLLLLLLLLLLPARAAPAATLRLTVTPEGDRAVRYLGRDWTLPALQERRALAPSRFDAAHPRLAWVLADPDRARDRRALDPARFDRWHPSLGWLLGGPVPPGPPPPLGPGGGITPPALPPPPVPVPEPRAVGLVGLLAVLGRAALRRALG